MNRLPLLLVLIASVIVSKAQQFPNALPDGTLPRDSRLKLRTLNDYFPFHPVEDRADWEQRSQDLRRQMLVATGLWPMPTKTPLNAVVHGKVERDDFTVERVYFESFPGHFVTGSLFRPNRPARGTRMPGVLSPHGHWKNGRFYRHGDETMRKELESGAEVLPESGRYPLQARCVQLARMGCVVFHYDMVGNADSVQLDHRMSARNDPNGFYSAAGELRSLNMMGLQTYNSIRALDFLLTLPDVDSERIGVTGASGGGTQTFMLGAVDDRPDVLFPAVMVSTSMQGGCNCENASYLRIGAGNVDIAATIAPRPMGLTGADDWTKEIATKGQPDLERVYGFLGEPDHLRVAPFIQFGHNYNAVSRQVMYAWFNEHLQLGLAPALLKEREFMPLSQEELTVWNEAHPAPKSRDQVHERAVLGFWESDSQMQINRLVSRVADDAQAASDYRILVGGAWETVIGRKLDDVEEISHELIAKEQADGVVKMTGLLTNGLREEQVPALFLHPGDGWNGETVIWICSKGKRGLLDDNDQPIVAVAELLGKGYSVVGIDLLHSGEFTVDGNPVTHAPMNGGSARWKGFSGYTHGYNPPLFVSHVHDILTAVAFISRNEDWKVKAVHLAGMDQEAAPLVLAARTQCGEAIAKTMARLRDFRFDDLEREDDPSFVPGAVKFGDVGALIALCAPSSVVVETALTRDLDPAAMLYLAADASDQLQIVENGDDWLAD